MTSEAADIRDVRSKDVFAQLHMVARDCPELRPGQVIDKVAVAYRNQEGGFLGFHSSEAHEWEEAIEAYWEHSFFEKSKVFDPEELIE